MIMRCRWRRGTALRICLGYVNSSTSLQKIGSAVVETPWEGLKSHDHNSGHSFRTQLTKKRALRALLESGVRELVPSGT
jgi:hypothetical protein